MERERRGATALRGLACPKRVEFRGWPKESLKEFKRKLYGQCEIEKTSQVEVKSEPERA